MDDENGIPLNQWKQDFPFLVFEKKNVKWRFLSSNIQTTPTEVVKSIHSFSIAIPMSSHYSFPPPGGAPNANSPNPLRPYYTSSDSPLQSYYYNTLSSSTLEEELAAQNEINSQAAAKELASYGLVKYMTLAIAAPFEAGQTLLQVQYLPNDDGFNGDDIDLAEKVCPIAFFFFALRCLGLVLCVNNGDTGSRYLLPCKPKTRRDEAIQRARIEEEAERDYYNRTGGVTPNAGGYYASQYSTSQYSSHHETYSTSLSTNPNSANDKLDAKDPLNEYTIRESVYDEESRPAYQMAPIEGGVWKAITDLAKHPTEGWLSLWKGTYDSYGNWKYD